MQGIFSIDFKVDNIKSDLQGMARLRKDLIYLDAI